MPSSVCFQPSSAAANGTSGTTCSISSAARFSPGPAAASSSFLAVYAATSSRFSAASSGTCARGTAENESQTERPKSDNKPVKHKSTVLL